MELKAVTRTAFKVDDWLCDTLEIRQQVDRYCSEVQWNHILHAAHSNLTSYASSLWAGQAKTWNGEPLEKKVQRSLATLRYGGIKGIPPELLGHYRRRSDTEAK